MTYREQTTGQIVRDTVIAALLLVSAALPGQEPTDTLDLQSELATLVDLPSAAARQKAAQSLSGSPGVTLEAWARAMRDFGSFVPQNAGLQTHEVPLVVLGETEQTALHIYVPQAYDPTVPAPLLLMGHGAGGSGQGQHFMWQRVADRLGMLVLSPTEASDNRGWAFTPRERHSALAAVRWTRRNFNVDENRIFCSGISRGGHMTWDLALRYPDVFAAIAPMIGGPRLNIAGGQNNLRYLENLTRLPIRDLQGSKDDPLLLFNLRLGFERLEGLGATDAELIEFPELGHSFQIDAVDWAEFFTSKSRQALPSRVTRLATRQDEARAFWVEILRFERDVEEEFRPRVQADEWNELDDTGRRVLLADQALERTARLAVSMTAPGMFTAEGVGVRRFRLLLTSDMFEVGEPVEVFFNGKLKRIRPRQRSAILLADFAERLDRTFLPVAEVIVP